MVLFWIIFGLINVISLGLYLIISKRIFAYAKDHTYLMSRENLLLKLVNLKHLFIIYLIFLVAMIVLATIFIMWNFNLL